MKSLFDNSAAAEVKRRLSQLKPDSARQWGKMTAPQAVAHCSAGLEMALGDLNPPGAFIGRLLGPIVKPMALGDDKPFRRNSPTSNQLVVAGERILDTERSRLNTLLDRFVSGGGSACTTHPHPFFGPLKPAEWGVLMYKHLDHHLRQFGA